MSGSCAVCGFPYTEQAHVLPKSVCRKRGINKLDYKNTIQMCPNHHKVFDEMEKLVICPEGSHVIMKIENEINVKKMSRQKIIKKDYYQYRYNNNELPEINSESDATDYCGCC
jgi:hypothetical protein